MTDYADYWHTYLHCHINWQTGHILSCLYLSPIVELSNSLLLTAKLCCSWLLPSFINSVLLLSLSSLLLKPNLPHAAPILSTHPTLICIAPHLVLRLAWLAPSWPRRKKIRCRVRDQEGSYARTRFWRYVFMVIAPIPQHRSRRLAPPILANTRGTGEVAYRSLLSNRSLRIGTLELSSAVLLLSGSWLWCYSSIVVALWLRWGSPFYQYSKSLKTPSVFWRFSRHPLSRYRLSIPLLLRQRLNGAIFAQHQRRHYGILTAGARWRGGFVHGLAASSSPIRGGPLMKVPPLGKWTFIEFPTSQSN